jgi:hypothetical protein
MSAKKPSKKELAKQALATKELAVVKKIDRGKDQHGQSH